jgi:hypothetical protein
MLRLYIGFLQRNACMSNGKMLLQETPIVGIREIMSMQKLSHLLQ